MQVNLTEAEIAALLKALNFYIPNLSQEIGATENYDWRQAMHAESEALTGLVAKLGGSMADSNLPDIGADNPPWGGTK